MSIKCLYSVEKYTPIEIDRVVSAQRRVAGCRYTVEARRFEHCGGNVCEVLSLCGASSLTNTREK